VSAVIDFQVVEVEDGLPIDHRREDVVEMLNW
jgi:hypothetical protein